MISPPIYRNIYKYKLGISLTNCIAALSGLAVVLLLRRTPGIGHDSVLYLGQGLLHRYPEIFSNDIFFLYDGQSQYTIFPWLLGWVLHWVKPLPIFMIGTLVGLLLFTVATWYCLKTLLPDRQRYIAWMGVLCLPPMYGYTQIFSYSEAFFTMRIYTESLCLFAIAFLIYHRWFAVIVCLFIAGLLHLLQMLVILPFIWLWLVVKNRRWLHALWLVLPIMILALIKVHPLDGLFQQTDSFWLMTIQLSPHLFITLWNAEDFINLTFDLFILILAYKQLSSPFNILCGVSIISLLLGITGTLVLVDWLHLILPTGLQLWRVHWLAHWFAMASFSLLLLNHWREKQWPQAVLLMFIGIIAWNEKSWTWLGLAAVYWGWFWLVKGTRIRLKSLLGGLFGLGLGLLFIKYVLFHWKIFSTIGNYDLTLHTLDHYLLLFPLLSFSLVLLGLYLWNRWIKCSHWWLVLVLLFPPLLWGGLKWDARSDVRRYTDSLASTSNIFGIDIPENSQVYWNIKSPILSWLILRRAHYYSYLQMAGQVFNRKTAVEGYYRWLRIEKIENELATCQSKNVGSHNCHISDTALYNMCDPSILNDSYPPDYLILPFIQTKPSLGQWPIYDPYNGKLAVNYYLYRCKDIIKGK